MAAGTFTASLANPYRVDKASSGENQRPQKSVTPLVLVGQSAPVSGLPDIAPTTLPTSSFLQLSSTFDLGNDPGALIKVIWPYASAATLTLRLKASMDNGATDPYSYVEEYGIASGGGYTPAAMEVIVIKTGPFDDGVNTCRFAIPYKDSRRRFFQLWGKADNATTTLSGYVGGGTNQ